MGSLAWLITAPVAALTVLYAVLLFRSSATTKDFDDTFLNDPGKTLFSVLVVPLWFIYWHNVPLGPIISATWIPAAALIFLALFTAVYSWIDADKMYRKGRFRSVDASRKQRKDVAEIRREGLNVLSGSRTYNAEQLTESQQMQLDALEKELERIGKETLPTMRPFAWWISVTLTWIAMLLASQTLVGCIVIVFIAYGSLPEDLAPKECANALSVIVCAFALWFALRTVSNLSLALGRVSGSDLESLFVGGVAMLVGVVPLGFYYFKVGHSEMTLLPAVTGMASLALAGIPIGRQGVARVYLSLTAFGKLACVILAIMAVAVLFAIAL